MRETLIGFKILDAVSLLTATFTAAVTDIITSNTHGLSTGDAVVLTTTDTLPAGLSTATKYYVLKIDANTFKLSTDRPHDDNAKAVDITSTGTGTHTWTVSKDGEPCMVESYRHKEVSISVAGFGAGDSATVKIKGSSEDEPDFIAAKSASNDWDYIQLVDTEDGSSVDGDTGVAFADSNDLRKFAINVDGLKWICAEITSQSDTANTTVTVILNAYND